MIEKETAVAAESDIEIEVVDDTPEEDKVSPKDAEAAADFDISEEEIGQYSDRVQKRIKRLKYEFHEQRRAKEVAQKENQEALAHAQRMLAENRDLKNLIQQGNQALFNATESKANTELQMAEKEFREAYDAGDTARIVAAQKQINDAQYSQKRVEEVRPPKEQSQVANPQPQPQPQQQQQYVAPPDPRAIEWLRQNEWFGKDTEMTAVAYAVHDKLIKERVDPRSEHYYERVDQRVREVFPDRFEDGALEKVEVPRKSVVAPATRNAKTPRKVTLNNHQVNLAKKLGITVEQYANQIAKEMAHGR